MNVTVTWETENPFAFDAEKLIRRVATACLAAEGWPEDAELELLLTDDEGIREINAESRGIDSPTDVLSFPAVDAEGPGAWPSPEEDPFAYDPESDALLLGDTVISADRVRAQAAAYGHSERRELAFLTAHSLYHLMGYDHETPEEALVMEQKQEAVLESLGLSRDAD